MNYLAHLYLAQPAPDSYHGNLLGDFQRGVQVAKLRTPVYLGLQNHIFVDKFTDHHPEVQKAKTLFSPQRRRFSGIALDVLFDHFLIKHWSEFSDQTLDDFKYSAFAALRQQTNEMPDNMQRVVSAMIAQDWFASYTSRAGIYRTLDNISRRIRFKNNFAGSGQDIEREYQTFESVFLNFFPQLVAQVKLNGPEYTLTKSAN